MQKYADEGGFLARQLADTAYMSRLAREYVSFVCPPENVWTTTGQLTGMLRGKWGLNRLLAHDDLKNRRDHRHHAIDAVVIATIDRPLIKRVADASSRASAAHTGRLLEGLGYPWPSFLPGLENALSRVVVSYRPDHNAVGPLHNATAYGAAERRQSDEPGVATKALVHHYIPLASIATRKAEDVRKAVIGSWLSESIARLLETHHSEKRALAGALEEFGKRYGIRRIRWRESQTVIPIASRNSSGIYKFVVGDGNYCYEIYAGKNGKWASDGIVSMFMANGAAYRSFQSSVEYRSRTFSGSPLIMRLIPGDYVRVRVGDTDLVYRVQQITKGKIILAYHLGAGDQTRDPLHVPGIQPVMTVAPSSLQSLHGRRVFVDILGRVFDPGFKDAAPDTGDC
jgi:CRISPR-associated endonuclease Csn1